MKKIVLLFTLFVSIIILIGCNNNLVTHRTVEKMNETTKDNYYQTEFTNLDGRTVIRVKKDNNDNSFKCIASLSSGIITVKYVNSYKNETILFKLNKNESIDDNIGYITSNDKGYLIIETIEVSSGTIYISWN